MIGARARAAALVVALVPLASACIGPGDFRCTEHAQCAVGVTQSFCEANGRCSAADPRCLPSHRRYVHRAGDDADACVPQSCAADPSKAVDTVSAGGGHACLLRRDHTVWCWGRNDRGQLGDGTHTPRPLPVRVAPLGNIVAVAAGDAHTCAAEDGIGGRVFCWGADDLGQLGDGGGIDRSLPVQVRGVSGMIALAAGRDFSCAGGPGGVSCWGDDSVGQLGDGATMAGAHPAQAVVGLSGMQSLSASWQHACALSMSGRLTCWGANGSGQIGDGTQTSPRAPTLVNDPSAMMPLPTFDSVATGREHTCALALDDSNLYCWGANAQGQVNPLDPGMPIATPAPVTGVVTDPVDVAAGAQHTCVRHQGNGATPVTCWGANGNNQLGAMLEELDAADLFAGGTFSCALGRDGALFCWGDNHFGQLAIGGDTVRATPAPVPGLAHGSALAAGGAHNCATADDTDGARTLFCWGANGDGQIGDGSLADAPAATRIPSLQPTAIAAGGAHTCAIPADRQLRCWGWGAAGQLGRSPGADMVVTVPTEIDLAGAEGGDGVFALAAGAMHTCVGATISTSVLCFGLDTDGQLGDGKLVPGGPAPVGSFYGRPKAMAAGDAHTCAIDADGAVWCWGRNDEGQLGDDSVITRPTQTMISLGNGGVPADAITAGAAHTCALAGGQVLCWGRNAESQLGQLHPAPMLTPQLVAGLAPATAVAAGGHHTCAIGDDATVSCWGANESGQLGNGDTESKNAPVPVPGLTNVDGIVAGGAHSCAHRTDGTVWCWGANTSGQLGDGVTLTSGRALLARIACE